MDQEVKERRLAIWRLFIALLIFLFVAGAVYYTAKGISWAYNSLFGNRTSQTVFSPSPLGTGNAEPVASGSQQVVSTMNIIPVNIPASANPNVALNQQINNPGTGASQCPDYLGDVIACVQNPPK